MFQMHNDSPEISCNFGRLYQTKPQPRGRSLGILEDHERLRDIKIRTDGEKEVERPWWKRVRERCGEEEESMMSG